MESMFSGKCENPVYEPEPGLQTIIHNGKRVLVNPNIGGWAVVSNKEYVQLLRAGTVLPPDIGEQAYQYGLARKNGQSVFGPIGTRDGVLFFEFHVSDECNLACPYCSSGTKPVGKIAQADPTVGVKWIDRVYEFCRMKGQRKALLELTGGEPLANVEFLDQIIAYALARAGSDICPKIILVTNLTIVGPRQIELLKRYPIDLSVSLDGDQLSNDSQRRFASGAGTFEVVRRNIARLTDIGIPPTTLQTTVTSRTVERMTDTVRMLMAMGYTHLNLEYMTEAGTQPEARELKPDPRTYVEQLFNVFRTIFIPFWRSTGVMPYARHLTVTYAYLLEPKRTYMCQCSPCGSGSNLLCTKSNGDVYGCATGPWDDTFRFGNIFHNTLEECQRSAHARESASRSVLSLPDCRDCLYRGWCQGGCPKEAYTTTGTIFAPSPTCAMYKALWARALNSLIDREFPDEAVREQARYYMR